MFLLPTIFLGVSEIRQNSLSFPLLKRIKTVLPPMSDTERAAIEAGSVWWEAELFRGAPDWGQLLHYKTPELSDEEAAFIDGPVEQLCSMIDDWDITHNRMDLPEEMWAFLKQNGFFGMIIPKKYGGLEFSAYGHSCVVMKLSARSISVGVTVMVPNSLGPAELLYHYGTDAQKNHYLPRLADGREIPCFALTGPDAGSDAGSIPDTGVVCKGSFEGKQVLGLNLNWEKRYITLGPVATVLGLAFKVYDPDGLLGDEVDLGITCALIPAKTPGVEIGNRHFPMNSAFQNGPNSGKDVFIPMEYIIGGKKNIGKGWRMLVESLSAGRGISLP
ncbi:MAG: acyl-CoA dehydrogenase family protein, partial [Proteobacteria bacterium]|nr:acyl-CoA dehydrogenase family protein [Pseudomonadota bacterium]